MNKTLAALSVCVLPLLASAADYPDLPWKFEGSTERPPASSVESNESLSDLIQHSWDVLESVETIIRRYPFSGLILFVH